MNNYCKTCREERTNKSTAELERRKRSDTFVEEDTKGEAEEVRPCVMTASCAI